MCFNTKHRTLRSFAKQRAISDLSIFYTPCILKLYIFMVILGAAVATVALNICRMLKSVVAARK